MVDRVVDEVKQGQKMTKGHINGVMNGSTNGMLEQTNGVLQNVIHARDGVV